MIPDNVEKIIMTKEDYDRNVEQLLLQKLELEVRIDKAIEYIKNVMAHNSSNDIASRRKLLEILRNKEQEEYTLTKDENGTTQINGEWYRVEKIK